MSERRFFWQAVDERTAVAWARETFGDGAEVITGLHGLVQWGDVTWQSLQDVQLSELHRFIDRRGYPTWEQEQAPSEAEVREAWRRTARSRSAQLKRAEAAREHVEAELRGLAERLLRGGQSVDSFYMGVAEYYQLAHMLDGKPTTAIAVAAEVPKSTAARWVREARKRGYLPPTRRGKSQS